MRPLSKNERRTEIICIIDRSGSMDAIREASIVGINTFIDGQRELSDAADVTMVFFNNRTMTLYMSKPINSVPQITKQMYEPDGNTALLDAIGEVVGAAEIRQKALGDQVRIGKTIVCILTDGLENASTDYTLKDIQRLISRKREDGWEFVYLGADHDVYEEGAKMGIDVSYCKQYEHTSEGVDDMFCVMHEMVGELRELDDEE